MRLSANPIVSCLECQRRKQKASCNRQFPCNHCSKRGVAHLCHFVSKATRAGSAVQDGQSKSVISSRCLVVSSFWCPLTADGCCWSSRSSRKRNQVDSSDDGDALIALGYMPHDHNLVLGNDSGPKVGGDPMGMDEGSVQSEELKAAMMTMPAKPYTDCLVDNWLGNANYHYYPLYPPEFRTQYVGWWATSPGRVTPELTSLILRVCACSALYLVDGSVKERLESELRADTWKLANRMHDAAEKLNASIKPGKGGLIQVQQLFLTAVWYKSAEKFTDAWHALSGAIRAGNEIGLHKDSLSEGMSEFDREMRRRLWGLLYMWDFALGSMLSRPLLINHADCTFVAPSLALEMDPEHPDQPSPFRHMNLHCKLCLDMLEILSSASSDVASIEVAMQLRELVESWIAGLPAEYALVAPDARWDKDCGYVVFQRRYLHLIGYMFLLNPLKPYMKLNSAKPMTANEKSLRAAGVQAALGLMSVAWTFFEHMASAGVKFHYAVFCIFDTSTILCSAFVHDEAHDLPQRETILEAVIQGLNMLEELSPVSRTTASLCRILKGLVAKLPLSTKEKGLIGRPKRVKASSSSSSSEGGDMAAGSSRNDLASHLSETTGANSSSSDNSSNSAASVSAVACLPNSEKHHVERYHRLVGYRTLDTHCPGTFHDKVLPTFKSPTIFGPPGYGIPGARLPIGDGMQWHATRSLGSPLQASSSVS
ncbi:hypothetical protein B0T19DRAFT_447867 [Cercophora scortea]|uniref:Zn(2)-C6 fungal-type domain-containing protein n=1 Tax=Cercophora scortea TaxID=314031 RepID=A0AAE0MLR9_9PEZI|nr:hypothetical protein B0T19DRAFT_447867 [Cercophora scortea]